MINFEEYMIIPLPPLPRRDIVRTDTGETVGTIPAGYAPVSLADVHTPGEARRNDPEWFDYRPAARD